MVEGAFNIELFILVFNILYLTRFVHLLLVMTALLLFWIMPEFTIQTNS